MCQRLIHWNSFPTEISSATSPMAENTPLTDDPKNVFTVIAWRQVITSLSLRAPMSRPGGSGAPRAAPGLGPPVPPACPGPGAAPGAGPRPRPVPGAGEELVGCAVSVWVGVTGLAVQVIKELQLETLERQCHVARENCYAAATLFYTRKPKSLEKMFKKTATLCKKLAKQKIVEEPCDTFVSITSERPGWV